MYILSNKCFVQFIFDAPVKMTTWIFAQGLEHYMCTLLTTEIVQTSKTSFMDRITKLLEIFNPSQIPDVQTQAT